MSAASRQVIPDDPGRGFIGEQLEHAMRKANLTISALAAKLEIDESTVGKWVANKRPVPDRRINALLKLGLRENFMQRRRTGWHPCATDGCLKLVGKKNKRCWPHALAWSRALMRQRWQDPAYRIAMREKMAAVRQHVIKNPKAYTKRELSIIREFAGRERVDVIAARCSAESGIQRSAHAIREHAKVLGLTTSRAGYTRLDIARIFGVDPSQVRGWMQKEILHSSPWGSLHISFPQDIEVFIRDYPWMYDHRKVGRPFKGLADVVQRRDPWWTLVDAQRETGLTNDQLRRLMDQGELLFRRRSGPHGGVIVVRASDLDGIHERHTRRLEVVRAIRRSNLIPGGPRASLARPEYRQEEAA